MCEQHQGWFGILFFVISDDCALSCFGSAIAFPPYVCMGVCVYVSMHVIINKSMIVFLLWLGQNHPDHTKKKSASMSNYMTMSVCMHVCVHT